ncbi:MAG TPA: hypothetical protein VEL47_04765 [Myxococcota bacterium]|nr:hypothetical protein [Myxococcota bacterium]
MKNSIKPLIACLLLASALVVTGCDGKKEQPSPEPQPQPTDCQGLKDTACVAKTGCRFLKYPTGDDRPGLCVNKTPTEANCDDIKDLDRCLLVKYLPGKECKLSADSASCEAVTSEQNLTLNQIFGLAKAFRLAGGGTIADKVTEFNKHYAKLTPEDRVRLATEEKDATTGATLVDELVQTPMAPEVEGVIEEVYKDIKDVKFKEQINKEVGGKNALALLLTNYNTARPVGNAAAPYKKAVIFLADKGAETRTLPTGTIVDYLTLTNPDKEALVKFYNVMDKNAANTDAWIKYLVDNQGATTKGAFRELATGANKLGLIYALITKAAKEDTAPGAAVKTRLSTLISQEWIDGADLRSTMDFGGAGAGKAPVALAKFLFANNTTPNTPISDSSYLLAVTKALRTRLGNTDFDAEFVADPNVQAGIVEKVAGATPADKIFLAQTILGLDTVQPIWNAINQLNLNNPATRAASDATLDTELKKIFGGSDEAIRRENTIKLINQRVGNAAAVNTDLQLSNILMRAPFTETTKKYVIKILEVLPAAGAVTKKDFLQQAAGPMAAAAAGQWALADLFVFRPLPGMATADAPNMFAEVAVEVSKVAGLDLADQNSVGPKFFEALIATNFATHRAAGMSRLTRVTSLPSPGADSLRTNLIRDLVTRRTLVGANPVGTGIIHKIFKNGIDPALATAFTTMANALESNDARRLWFSQTDGAAIVVDVTVVSDLLLRPAAVGAIIADTPASFKAVIDQVAAIPALAANTADLTAVWNFLNTKGFANAANRTDALAVLTIVANLPDNNDLRRSLTRGLAGVGGALPTAIAPGVGIYSAPAAAVAQQNAGLIQAMTLGVIDAPLVAIYRAVVADQDDVNRKALLDQALGAHPAALLNLTDGPGGAAGGRFAVAAAAPETEAARNELLRLFAAYGAVASLEANYNGGRSDLVFDRLMPVDAADTNIVTLFENVGDQNHSRFARWGIADTATHAPSAVHAPAVKRVMQVGNDAAQIALQSQIFRRALIGAYGDFTARVVAGNPNSIHRSKTITFDRVYRTLPVGVWVAAGLAAAGVTAAANSALPRLELLNTNLANYGLTAVVRDNDYVFAPTDTTNTLLTFLLKVANAELTKMPNPLAGVPVNAQDLRKKALVRSLALYVRDYLNTAVPGFSDAAWKAYVDATAIAAARLPGFQQSTGVTDEATAKKWLFAD